MNKKNRDSPGAKSKKGGASAQGFWLEGEGQGRARGFRVG